jgi:hypothetical protein
MDYASRNFVPNLFTGIFRNTKVGLESISSSLLGIRLSSPSGALGQ